MRLVEQQNLCDVPYELCSLTLENHYEKFVIIVRSELFEKRDMIFARYSTVKKAERVLEMIRNKYSKLEILKIVYQNGLAKKMERELGFDESAEMFTPIFKFPDDDEVVIDG